jgi:hypothetical protein
MSIKRHLLGIATTLRLSCLCYIIRPHFSLTSKENVMPGLFDNDLSKFDSRAPDESGNVAPGKASIIVGFIGGTVLSWLILVILTSVGFRLLGINWQAGNWLWPIALACGIGAAALLHELDKRGSSKYLVPICYILSLVCLLLIMLLLWMPQYFRLAIR